MCTTMKELEVVIADYRSLKVMKEELEKLTETGKDFSIKVSTCERRTLDSKRLEADLGSLAEYQRISQYRRLYVK